MEKMIEVTIVNILIILGVILVSMTLHEVMHGFMAYWLGDDTAKLQGRLTLNPVSHIDPFLTILLPLMLAVVGAPVFGGAKPVPFNPYRVRYGEWGAALVALAGPLTNLLIAFLIYGIGVVLGSVPSASGGSTVAQTIISYGIVINLGFFIFNMIPFPPLDGSRILYALAPDFVRRGMEYIEPYGIVLVFMLVFFASNYTGIFISQSILFLLDVFSKIFML